MRSVTIDQVIEYLNELLELDKPVIAAMVANRIPCNQKFADHPTVQVHSQHGGYHVGLLGILNGMFEVLDNGWGPITMVFDDDSNLLHFRRTENKK